MINITAGPDLTLFEVNEASTMIQEDAHQDANIIFGAVIDETAGEEVRVTVIATGFGKEEKKISEDIQQNISVISRFMTDDKDIPSYARRAQNGRSMKPEVVKVGTIIDSCFNDNGDYDTPTFLRMQAE